MSPTTACASASITIPTTIPTTVQGCISNPSGSGGGTDFNALVNAINSVSLVLSYAEAVAYIIQNYISSFQQSADAAQQAIDNYEAQPGSPGVDAALAQEQGLLYGANAGVIAFQYISTYAQQVVNDTQTALSLVQALLS